MKQYLIVTVALASVTSASAGALAQVQSSSSACVAFVCNTISSATLTSSTSKTGASTDDFANAHTGVRAVNPIPNRSDAVQAGTSGVAVSATPGVSATADASWSDAWMCDVTANPCSLTEPQFGTFQWVLHLHGVLDPILVTPSSDPEHGEISLALRYGDQNNGYSFTFSVCYDSGPCNPGGSAFSATLNTPSGQQDLTPNIVLGTNAQGQPTLDLDVSLGTNFCAGITPGNPCVWGDSFRANAQIDNSGTTTHFLDFSGTFDAAAVSLDPLSNWVSAGGRTAPTFSAPVTATGLYLQPLAQSTDATNPVINNIKNGRVIPVKVRLSQGTTPITDQNAPGPITIFVSAPIACSSAPAGDIGTYADAGQSNGGTNQYRYDATLHGWIYNLDTRALGLSSGKCYGVGTAVNGTPITNAFVVIRPTM